MSVPHVAGTFAEDSGTYATLSRTPMLIRDARPEDWPQIWPFLTQIVAAGETYAYDPDVDEASARALWLVARQAGPWSQSGRMARSSARRTCTPTARASGRTSPARA